MQVPLGRLAFTKALRTGNDVSVSCSGCAGLGYSAHAHTCRHIGEAAQLLHALCKPQQLPSGHKVVAQDVLQ